MERCDFRESTHAKIKGKIYEIIEKWGINKNGTLRSPKRGGFGVNIFMEGISTAIVMTDVEAYYRDVPMQRMWSDVEREIIMADIAFLKQKEIESGAWAKWEESQKRMGYKPSSVQLPTGSRRYISRMMGLITRDQFMISVGREPINDDLDRCNCTEAGTIGHTTCGWCMDCNQPRFVCGHAAPRRRG